MSIRDQVSNDCCGVGKRCGNDLDRRTFLKLAGMSAGLAAMPIMAGPFGLAAAEADGPIPLDKRLDPVWLKSLFERGVPTTYTGWEQLQYIGMPIGGIGTGTVYLGGDGKLWCWDIFNEHHLGVVPNTNTPLPEGGGPIAETSGPNYVAPPAQTSPWNIDHGFALRMGNGPDAEVRMLDRQGFANIRFTAQYPIATVDYKDEACPVEVTLEAFSPFIPLDVERSSYPAAVLRYRIKNTSDKTFSGALCGWLVNPVLGRNGTEIGARRVNSTWRVKACSGIHSYAEAVPQAEFTPREDIFFENFERDSWGDWTAEGPAFEGGPFPVKSLADYQRITGQHGEHLVNSHNTRVADGVTNADDLTGTLTSAPFTIERRYIKLRIAGGNRPGETFVEVLVNGESVAQASGDSSNDLKPAMINLVAYEGQQAQLRIVDKAQGGWGNVQVDAIVFTDEPLAHEALEQRADFGSMALVMTNPFAPARAQHEGFALPNEVVYETKHADFKEPLRGLVELPIDLPPGEEREVTCVLAWHFPNSRIPGYPNEKSRRWYASKYKNAQEVAQKIAFDLQELTDLTRRWQQTWYDSSLPHWFLERSLVTADALQTNTCYRFEDGRFWAWEGVGCCHGTCTHVWHYAQAVGRLFPELERDLRERTDYGIAFNDETGLIRFRGEFNDRDATDGQAGVILRTYREHQMSPDDGFLRRVWPRCKKTLEFLIGQDMRDGAPDGIPVGEQHNTLDAEWFGKVPVLASLYLAALRAGEAMAKDIGDTEFEQRCREIHARGMESIKTLFKPDFGFFVQEVDPEHLDAIGVGDGCYIDQVMGQWWAFQLGLGRLYDKELIHSALQSLWDYNFCPDMGRLRASIENAAVRGRPYALAGDAGLVMCTWPKGGKRDDWEKHWQFGYFNECMTGFEYEAAGHMIWEGTPEMIEHGLAICRAIHDRYDGRLRNPYNEIECSDHYARAMASYGAFLAACGFEYDGPRGHIGFAPRLTPEKFKAAFTAAEGWGSYEQVREAGQQVCRLTVHHGEAVVETLSVVVPSSRRVLECSARWHDAPLGGVVFEQTDERVLVRLSQRQPLKVKGHLEVVLKLG
jgi:uncharacterized protein (DUF608 family)